GCTAATLAVVQFDIEDVRVERPSWASVMIPWVALAWAGVTLQIQAGTAAYAAVPVSALTTQIFALIAIAALLGAGIVPWRGWAVRIWMRPSLRAASVTAATLLPLGLYLLVRAYELGNGRYPQSWLNLALATWGVLGRADALEPRNAFGLVAVAGAATWLVAAAAAARSVGLPAGRRRQATDSLALVAAVLAVAVLAAGPAVAALASITSDAIAGVMTLPTGGLAPDPLSIITVSTRLPAVALFGPLLLLGAAAVALSKPGPATTAAQSKAALFDV